MIFIYVGTEDMRLPSKNVCLFQGGVDEVGLENSAIRPPHCGGGNKNVVLSNFSVENALRYAFPICDCSPSTVYIIFKQVEKVFQFMNSVPSHKKMWVKNMLKN
jgi:hypothetical protein